MDDTKLNGLIEQTVRKLHEYVYDSDSLNRRKIQMFHFINQIAELKFPPSVAVIQNNSSLDGVDWVSARSAAHEMLNSSLDYIQYARDRPV
jgi:hypothetical protein